MKKQQNLKLKIKFQRYIEEEIFDDKGNINVDVAVLFWKHVSTQASFAKEACQSIE